MPHLTAQADLAALPVAMVFTDGGGYIDDATDALQSGSVYVSPEVADASALQSQLTAQVGDSSIGIAVFSENAALEASGSEIVSQLAEATTYDTIIVAVGDDLSAGSRVLDTGEAMQIANEAQSGGSLDQTLTTTVQNVQEAEPAASGGTAGGAGGIVLPLAITIAVLAAGAAAVFGVIRSRRRGALGARDTRLPDAIRRHVATLRSLSIAYAQVGAAGNQVAAQTATDISGIATNVEELFTRLDQRSGADQRGLAAIELDATLRRLTGALDRDYLLDILTHPQLWDDPDERVREVRNAVSAVSEELVQNIKQVNARRGLHFQVSLDGLMGKRSELQQWERAFEQAADEGDAPPASPAPRA
ncbi:hypothetical protein [Agromyces aureus]|uniref:Uncharacterized protein n=1 Tax=Agromyces aureus TaxID=453304 RepID=A0A191WB73_9MICO|nr:hypothetical protein [Agromyces aureus]ANJ25487.1 hypothetical protein ATC03_00590 [Agromyces aureus]